MRTRLVGIMLGLMAFAVLLSLWGSLARAQPHNPPLIQNGPVQFWPYLSGSTAAAITATQWAPSFTETSGAVKGHRLAPTLVFDTAIAPIFSAIQMDGSIENRQNPILYIMNTFQAQHRSFSATTGVAPLLPDQFVDQMIIEQTAGTSTTAFATISNLNSNTHRAHGGDFSLTGHYSGNTIRAGVYGSAFQPAFCADTGNTMQADQVTALWMKNPPVAAGCTGAGTVTLGQVIPIDIQRMVAGTTNMSFRFSGEANYGQHHGKLAIGGGGACNSTTDQVCDDAGTGTCAGSGASCSCDQDCLVIPSARLQVTEPVLGSEVARFESYATNDDIAEKVYQCRQTTTDATQSTPTTVATCAFPVTSNKVMTLHATVVAHCTAGASCTANNGAAYTIIATCKNNGGTTGAVTGSPDTISSAEDVAGWDITIDCDNTVDKARIRVIGAATTTITWHATVRTMEVGT